MTAIKVGVGVRRNISAADSNNGRTGNVVEVEYKYNKIRVRVKWEYEANGARIKNSSGGIGVRTWVKPTTLIVLPEPIKII